MSPSTHTHTHRPCLCRASRMRLRKTVRNARTWDRRDGRPLDSRVCLVGHWAKRGKQTKGPAHLPKLGYLGSLPHGAKAAPRPQFAISCWNMVNKSPLHQPAWAGGLAVDNAGMQTRRRTRLDMEARQLTSLIGEHVARPNRCTSSLQCSDDRAHHVCKSTHAIAKCPTAACERRRRRWSGAMVG